MSKEFLESGYSSSSVSISDSLDCSYSMSRSLSVPEVDKSEHIPSVSRASTQAKDQTPAIDSSIELVDTPVSLSRISYSEEQEMFPAVINTSTSLSKEPSLLSSNIPAVEPSLDLEDNLTHQLVESVVESVEATPRLDGSVQALKSISSSYSSYSSMSDNLPSPPALQSFALTSNSMPSSSVPGTPTSPKTDVTASAYPSISDSVQTIVDHTKQAPKPETIKESDSAHDSVSFSSKRSVFSDYEHKSLSVNSYTPPSATENSKPSLSSGASSVAGTSSSISTSKTKDKQLAVVKKHKKKNKSNQLQYYQQPTPPAVPGYFPLGLSPSSQAVREYVLQWRSENKC